MRTPRITYPPELPVSQRRDEIAKAIRDHQVVVVAGETGSGKTTQLPKICLELGRGVRGMIGHTQPRRIAARTVAEALVDMALSEDPEGAQPDEIAGPREEYLPDLAQLVAAKRGENVKVEAVSNPADPDDALNANGGLLPSPHATLTGPTFAEWLNR